jgi:uncharacterized protein
MSKQLYIKNVTGKGRGVFCKQLIAKNEVFEMAPLIVLPAADYNTATASVLTNYFFNFNKEEKTLALVLGFGSLYNHALHSNAAYSLNPQTKTMEYYALEEIKPGTEICINYGGESGKEYKEWFESRNIILKTN